MNDEPPKPIEGQAPESTSGPGWKPPEYVATNMFRQKAYRRATRIMQLNSEIVALKGVLQAEKAQIERMSQITHELVAQLARMGVKVTFKEGQGVGFEPVR